MSKPPVESLGPSEARQLLAEARPVPPGEKSLKVERRLEGLRDTLIPHIFRTGREVASAMSSGVAPVEMPSGEYIPHEVVRSEVPGSSKEKVAVWYNPTYGTRYRILEITGEVNAGGGVTNEVVTYVRRRKEVETDDVDLPLDLDKGLIRSSLVVDHFQSAIQLEAERLATSEELEPERPPTREELLADLATVREMDYGMADTHLAYITGDRKSTGERVRLDAFKEWADLRQAEAEQILGVKDADDRVISAGTVIAERLRTGSATRTLYPDTYRTEVRFMDDLMSTLARVEVDIERAEAIPEPGQEGDENAAYSSHEDTRAQLKVINTLRKRQAKIESGELKVAPPPEQNEAGGGA